MASDEEAFPNSIRRFQRAFTADNPAPPLLLILKKHPTYLAVCDLAYCYVEAVRSNPYCAKTLASALASMIHSPDVPSFKEEDTGREETLSELLNFRLADTHFKSSDNEDIDKAQEYGPKNIYLLHSLLSGFSFKYNFTSTSDMFSSIERGLKAKCGSKESEVLVVGTCIQLLLHGFTLTTDRAGSYRRKSGEIAEELKAHKMAETVKDSRAIEVLEVHNLFLCP